MFKKLTIAAMVLFMLPMLLSAQERVILKSTGKVFKPAEAPGVTSREIQPLFEKNSTLKDMRFNNPYSTVDTDDTLHWNVPADVNFGYFGEDRMIQWFEAPADMVIHAAGYNTAATDDPTLGSTVRLVKLNWTKDQLMNAGVTNWGYYSASFDGNANGICATPFDLEFDPDNDAWVDVSGTGAPEFVDPVDGDLWSDGGFGWPVTPVADGAYQWVEMNDLGFEPTVSQGDIIGVMLRNSSTGLDADRIGFSASTSVGIPGFKYYYNGRLATGGPGVGDPGWWSRAYTWDFALAVTLTGDRAPLISDETVLATTISTEGRTVEATVTDDNPSGGDAGVASVKVVYSVDGGDAVEVELTGSGDVYSGQIPGQAPGSAVAYHFMATDVNGNSSSTVDYTYNIFAATSPYLFLYDADAYAYGVFGYAWPYFYGYNMPFHADTNATIPAPDQWDGKSNGPASYELISNYKAIFWVGGFYPTNSPTMGDDFAKWLSEGTADDKRALYVTGQDYGRMSGFADTTFPGGTFEHDYLGIETLGPQDIVGGTTDLYPIDPIEGDALTGYIFDAQTTSGGKLAYDPTQLSGTNWVDNVVATGDANVHMTDPNNGGSALYITKSGEGWDAAYLHVDPYCLVLIDEAADTVLAGGNITDYYRNIYDVWAESVDLYTTDIKKDEVVKPVEYKLSQNYPNPFNPTTSIKFSIPKADQVSLTVFDVLGREVMTLVNEQMNAGSYTVDFSAANLASGMYVYKLQAGDFVSTKKMMLLK